MLDRFRMRLLSFLLALKSLLGRSRFLALAFP